MTVQALELFEDHLLFIGRNTRPAIPDLQAEFALATTYAQQHRAVGITEGIGQKILQNPPQQLDVAVHSQTAAAPAEAQVLLLGQRLEFCSQGVEQLVENKGLALWVDLAVFQARNVQQIADQVFGRAQ